MRPARIDPRCALVLVAALSLGACTDVERCRIGTEGCICDAASACGEDDLICTEGVCEACTRGTLGCGCATVDTCLTEAHACVDGRCIPADRALCLDACRYANDGECDDGGNGSGPTFCTFGTDCADCGARPNPCTEPERTPGYPVFCPQTPDVEGGQCWAEGTNCAGLAYCEADGQPHACSNDTRYDCDGNAGAGACVTNPCTTAGYLTFCPYEAACLPGNTNCCFPTSVDCRTVTQCGTSWYTCWTGEMVDCGTAVDGDERCVVAAPP